VLVILNTDIFVFIVPYTLIHEKIRVTISIAFYLKLRAGSRSSGTVFHSGAIFFVQIHQWRGAGVGIVGE